MRTGEGLEKSNKKNRKAIESEEVVESETVEAEKGFLKMYFILPFVFLLIFPLLIRLNRFPALPHQKWLFLYIGI